MPKKTYEQLVLENKKIKELMTHTSETMRKACDDRYELQKENEELKEEIKSLKKSNAQKTKLIHKARKQLKETYDELKVENNDIQEEFDRYKFNYFFAEECEFCEIDLTYDDYQLSLDAGSWCCERCYDEHKEELENDRNAIQKENSDLHTEVRHLKKKLKDQAKYEKKIFVLEQQIKGLIK